MEQLTCEYVRSVLPQRKKDAHKGDFGRILLLCGSRGYTGAASLSAMGALRSGAGLVYLGVPKCVYEIVASKLTEPIVFPLPCWRGKFSVGAIYMLRKLMKRMDAVLIGPGMGESFGTYMVTKWILTHYNGPVVLDADGINVLVKHKNILRGRTSSTILTPHTGEFIRFSGRNLKNKVSDTVAMAKDLGVILVHKGSGTIVTDGKTVLENTTGNPGMAAGGSGDVLSGIITALLGQGLSPLDAAACGVWLHGAAGDICAEEIGEYGMLPSDLLLALPRLIKKVVFR